MAIRLVPDLEPSTDFPELGVPEAHRARGLVFALLVAFGLLLGSLGYLAGRADAPVPKACQKVADLGERALVESLAYLGTIEEGMRVFLDGEQAEAYSILEDAKLGTADLERLRDRFTAAADACRASV